MAHCGHCGPITCLFKTQRLSSLKLRISHGIMYLIFELAALSRHVVKIETNQKKLKIMAHLFVVPVQEFIGRNKLLSGIFSVTFSSHV